MKKIKKLSLKKESISNLDGKEMENLKGGSYGPCAGHTGSSEAGTSVCVCNSNLSYCPGLGNTYSGSGGGNGGGSYTVGVCYVSYTYCP